MFRIMFPTITHGFHAARLENELKRKDRSRVQIPHLHMNGLTQNEPRDASKVGIDPR